MRIHQITDLHVPDEAELPELRHVKPNVLRQLAWIEAQAPDLLVISGDLTMPDGSGAACEWLDSVLPHGIDTIIIPGNHDDTDVLWEVFGADRCQSERFYCAAQYGPWKLLFLNTQSDQLPPEQLDFLSAEANGVPAILFLHHPPDLVTDGFMARNQPLLNHEEAAAAVRASSVSHVFCGHYHAAMDKACEGFMLHVTPSPAFEIDLHSAEFRMVPFEPAVRVIDIEDESIRTHLVEV